MRTRVRRLALLSALAIVGSLTFLPTPAHADTITVDSGADTTTTDTACTLREAILNANNDDQAYPDCEAGTGTDEITIPNGYIYLTDDLPPIADPDGLSVVGVAASVSSIQGDNTHQGFYVDQGPLTLENVGVYQMSAGGGAGGGLYVESPEEATLINVQIQDSLAGTSGGAVFNAGEVTVTGGYYSGNRAPQGGAFANEGTLTVTDTDFQGNYANGAGGGAIYLADGGATIDQASVIYNHATNGHGGGIYVQALNEPELTLTNTTLSGNTADYPGECCAARGGAIVNDSKATLNNVTISDNWAEASGGGISGHGYIFSSTQISNTIISGNRLKDGSPSDCSDTQAFDSLGYNLGPETECVFNEATDVHGPALLGPAESNGHEGWIHALLDDSPALDAGSPAAVGQPAACEDTDQRKFARPIDGPDAGNAPACDIGAFERQTNAHVRTVSLTLSKHLIAKGSVIVDEDFALCREKVGILIQKKTKSGWKPAKTLKTNNNGKYETNLADKPLRYRAVTPKLEETFEGDNNVCTKAMSSVKRHRHN